mmetsp:Transcript_19343/g.28872  ORF Transcript_19343/g.28872 Transcript_19343/m.28872 type:complete len:95 (-) Transcript_19343:42-326(-)
MTKSRIASKLCGWFSFPLTVTQLLEIKMLCMEFWTAKARVASVVEMTIKHRSKSNAFLMFILPPPRHEEDSFFDDDDDLWTIVDAYGLVLSSLG